MLLVDCTSSNNHELAQNPIKLRRLNPNENKENIFAQESSWWTKTEELQTNSFVKTTIHGPLRSELNTKEHSLNERIENTNNFSESTQNNHTENNYDKRTDNPLKLIVRTMTTWLEDELQHKTPKVSQPEEQICLSEEDFEDITVELGFLGDFCSTSTPHNSQAFVPNENDGLWGAWFEDKTNTLSHQLDNHQIWIDNFSFEGAFPDADKDTSQQQQIVSTTECNSTCESDIAEPEVQEGEYLELLPTTMDVQVSLQDACIEDSDTDSDAASDTTDEECDMDASFDSELDNSMDLDDHDRRKIEKTRKKNLKIKEKLLALSKSKLREVYRDSRNRRRQMPLVRKIAHQHIQSTLLAVSNKDLHLLHF